MILDHARATAACLAALLSMTAVADAQQKTTAVPRSEAPVLLDMPGMERANEQFHYIGWNQAFSAETSYAAAQVGNGAPVAVAVKQQLAKGYVWRAATLDDKWIRTVAPFFKDKPITITRAGRFGSDSYLNTVLFSTEALNCVGYDFRRYAKGVVDAASGEVGYFGFYCGAPGAKVGEAEIPRIVGGIYTRADGRIQRAYELDTSPIPERLQR